MHSTSSPNPETALERPGSGNASLVFVLQAAAWVVALFALARLSWVEQNLLLPFAQFQGRVACTLAGTSPKSVFVGLSCTGADPMALVLGAVLAFPVAWRRRLKGAALGLGLILVLNTARIGTLSLVVSDRKLFELLHVYLWPAVLILAAATYVFVWMGSSLRQPAAPNAGNALGGSFGKSRAVRFFGLASLFVIAFYLLSPWLMTSAAVLEVARWAAWVAAGVMTALGIAVEVTGNTLRTSSGAWVVTQSCVATPLLPIFLAATAFLPASPLRRALAALAAFPLFLLLGSARLLVLALPAALVGSHSTAVHAFYQVLAAVLIVVWISRRTPRPTRTTLEALAVGTSCAYLAGWIATAWLAPLIGHLSSRLHLGHGWVDSQGVLALMPPFQLGFLLALWLARGRSVADRRLVPAIAFLGLGQVAALAGLGELAVHAAIKAPVVVVRAVSLALPLAIVWWDALSRIRSQGSAPALGPSRPRAAAPAEPGS